MSFLNFRHFASNTVSLQFSSNAVLIYFGYLAVVEDIFRTFSFVSTNKVQIGFAKVLPVFAIYQQKMINIDPIFMPIKYGLFYK